MQKFLLDLLQLIVITKVGYSLLRFAIGSTKRRKKSIVGKVWRLFGNRIHYYLDNALKKQKKVLHANRYKEVEYPPNVIPLRKTR